MDKEKKSGIPMPVIAGILVAALMLALLLGLPEEEVLKAKQLPQLWTKAEEALLKGNNDDVSKWAKAILSIKNDHRDARAILVAISEVEQADIHLKIIPDLLAHAEKALLEHKDEEAEKLANEVLTLESYNPDAKVILVAINEVKQARSGKSKTAEGIRNDSKPEQTANEREAEQARLLHALAKEEKLERERQTHLHTLTKQFEQEKRARLTADAKLKQQREIQSLLVKAQHALDTHRLTTPEHNNAVKWAEKVLQMESNNPAAREIMTKIISRYLRL